MFVVSIPIISNEELLKRSKDVIPVRHVDGVAYRYKEVSFDEIRGENYRWDYDGRNGSYQEKVEEELRPFMDIPCLHAFDHYNPVFTPNICDVLAQLDENLHLGKEKVKAFEIIECPTGGFNPSGKSDDVVVAYLNGYHVSKVRLYK